jgi:anthranilate phosphoribosyltransferase
MLEKLIPQLVAGECLNDDQVREAVSDLANESVSIPLKADFLAQLTKKGETTAEIAAFVRELRSRAVQPQIGEALRREEILDVVGTGGDRLSTFNISTTVALIASAAGVRVAKHGNRATTSLTGSADVIEALGIPFEISPEETVTSLDRHHFAFFFAPRYHPAFRHIVPARRLCAERGQSTIFNYLGPLLNPAHPSAMLIGVPRPDLCEPFAKVLQALGVRRAMVVCGRVRDEQGELRHLDELSPLGPTTVAEFYQDHGLNCSLLSPELFPIQPAVLADLKGGGREVNATIIRQVLSGKERGPKRDAVLLNAAAALQVAGRVRTLQDGWTLAAETIDAGNAWNQLQRLGTSPTATT